MQLHFFFRIHVIVLRKTFVDNGNSVFAYLVVIGSKETKDCAVKLRSRSNMSDQFIYTSKHLQLNFI